jgi:diadenosine tetraphosphate (Ap4A) HIT family hydrolase
VTDCPFCGIVAREVEASPVYDDDRVRECTALDETAAQIRSVL